MKKEKSHKHTLGIVIPVYKLKEEYLKKCIKSVLNQKNIDLEIVLVDDCSPDNCGELCDKIALNDSRIKVVHHAQNMGLPAARNSGFDVLDSQWVSFVDGDDWVDDNTFGIIFERMEQLKETPDFVMFPGCLSYKNSEIIDSEYIEKEWKTREEIIDLQTLAISMPLKKYPNRAVAFDTAWAKIVSTDYMVDNDIRFRELPYREDGMFFQEIVQHASYIMHVSLGMYHYRMTAGSMVHSYRPNAPFEQLKYLNMLFDFAKKNEKSDSYYKALYINSLVSMQVCITCFFYHTQNSADKERRRKCIEYFKQEPYSKVFKYVKFKDLKMNFLIKALLIKTRNYSLLNVLRENYLKNNHGVCFD